MIKHLVLSLVMAAGLTFIVGCADDDKSGCTEGAKAACVGTYEQCTSLCGGAAGCTGDCTQDYCGCMSGAGCDSPSECD